MDKKQKIIVALATVMVVSILFIASSVLAKKPVVSPEMVIWNLSKIQVVDEGTLVEMQEGIYYQGYTIEAKAKAKGGNIVPEGIFVLTMDVFSPYEDMPSQKAGFWYVQGTWTITKNNAPEEELKVKHNPNKAEGILMAELTYNPIAVGTNWTGRAVMQMGLAAGQWSRGDGTLTFNEAIGADLFLNLSRWQEVE